MKHNKQWLFVQAAAVSMAVLLALPGICRGAEQNNGKTLIIVYSRTGKSMLVAQTLKTRLAADLLAIKDQKDRSGFLGYCSAGYDAFFDRHTQIEPQTADVSQYEHLIIVSPIWNWKLSTPIHTFLDRHRFDGKQVVMVTTGNNDIRKYEQYDDRAPFLKRFFRDYIRGKSKTVRSAVTAQGGYFLKHYHVETLDASDQEIVARADQHGARIVEDFSVSVAARQQRDAELLRIAGSR